eukprot:TRINITY_DN303_c0_g1_i3.p1 TRINITY_DN303_c0_g1~~TRINITY_DN303_c0_g1_i3.p1  ORF type:complete len:344 (-),score=73.21 TRINITY_DN303_c0_g1_i3:69-1100(-)
MLRKDALLSPQAILSHIADAVFLLNSLLSISPAPLRVRTRILRVAVLEGRLLAVTRRFRLVSHSANQDQVSQMIVAELSHGRALAAEAATATSPPLTPTDATAADLTALASLFPQLLAQAQNQAESQAESGSPRKQSRTKQQQQQSQPPSIPHRHYQHRRPLYSSQNIDMLLPSPRGSATSPPTRPTPPPGRRASARAISPAMSPAASATVTATLSPLSSPETQPELRPLQLEEGRGQGAVRRTASDDLSEPNRKRRKVEWPEGEAETEADAEAEAEVEAEAEAEAEAAPPGPVAEGASDAFWCAHTAGATVQCARTDDAPRLDSVTPGRCAISELLNATGAH